MNNEDYKAIAKRVRGNIMLLIMKQECNTPDMVRVQTRIINYLNKVPIEELLKKSRFYTLQKEKGDDG